MSAGVARQHAGITGQIENCQTVVFLAYVTARAHALFDFRPCLPKQWCADRARRERAQVPADTVFATKTEQGTAMVTGAITAGVPFSWTAGDEVYGRSSKLRAACEKGGKGYVFAVPVNFRVTLPCGRKAAAASLTRLVPRRCWETRSCGRGCKGHRDYEWAWVATSSPRHWMLIRRGISEPAELAFFYCHAPGMVSLSILVKVAGKRWPVEECFQQGKGQTGLDQHQLRLWHSFCRHTSCPCAPSHCSPPASPASRNTGATPASWHVVRKPDPTKGRQAVREPNPQPVRRSGAARGGFPPRRARGR